MEPEERAAKDAHQRAGLDEFEPPRHKDTKSDHGAVELRGDWRGTAAKPCAAATRNGVRARLGLCGSVSLWFIRLDGLTVGALIVSDRNDQNVVVTLTRKARGEPGVMFVLLFAVEM